MESFEDLAKLRVDVPDDSPLLVTLAKMFESVGMNDEAVDCYLRSSRPPKEAVDCCVLLNQVWLRQCVLYYNSAIPSDPVGEGSDSR